jgi:hypothetical protein
MINYTDYDFYKDTYKGDMPKTDFNKLVTRASAEVQKNIFNRDIKGCEDEVQMATCSVADILLKIEQLETRKDKLVSSDAVDKVVSSESVGDLSRTFANTSNLSDLEKEISNQKNKIIEEIRLYLLHTGLLYRGV